MVSVEFRGAGKSPYTSAPTIATTAVERSAWLYFSSLADEKKAIWLDPSSPRFYRGLGAADEPAQARLLDRCGDRIFTPESVRNRHPIIITDSVTGRPVFMFGAGGSSPNALDSDYNGALICAEGFDAHGVGDNNASMWVPSVGFSIAFKARVPATNGTMNGATFTVSGGAVFGGATTADNDTSAAAVGVSNNGVSFVQTMVGGDGTSLNSGSTDFRNTGWHDFVMTYNASTTTLRIYEDGTEITPDTGATTDVASTAGSSKVMFGAYGNASGGPGSRFCGCIAFAAMFQGPVLEDSTARAAIRALMATR